MNLDLLAVFAAVAADQSFTEAARTLDLPRSTVSRHIATLESELGARLFHRTTRRVALTPFGRRLLDQVGPHLAALSRVCQANPAEEPRGVLRLTTTPDLASALLAEVVTRFVAEYPNIRVETVTSLDLLDLVGAQIDLAVRVTGGALPEDPLLSASRIGAIRLGLYASPRYLARAGAPKTLEELPDHALLAFLGLDQMAALPGEATVASNDTAFLHATCRAGAGIAVLPSFVAADDLQLGLLVPVLPAWAAWTGTAWLVSPYLRDAPAPVRSFREMLVDHVGRTTPLDAAATSEPGSRSPGG